MLKLVALMTLAQIPTPLDAMLIAHADMANIPADRRTDYLYLSMHNLTVKDIPTFVATLNGHCNSTSTRVKIKSLVNLNNLVLRANIRDYGWSRSTITKLADPRFTQVVDDVSYDTARPWEGGVWPGDGKFYQRGSFSYTPKRHKRSVNGVAPWLTDTPAGKAAAVDLVAWGGDFFPVVTALWFLNQTAVQEGRDVGYYDLLGIKSQKDFERITRYDERLAADLEHFRAVTFSGIALQPRRIEITRSVLGPVYRTGDNEKAVGVRNPLTTLDKKSFLFDATEVIAGLPNGLPGFLLADGKGTIQNKAPDNIVGGDRTTGSNDTRLQVGIGCIRCHNMLKGENFVKDIDFQKLARIKAQDYDTIEELERQYTRDIAPDIQQSRLSFGKAILEATGMHSQEYAVSYQRFFSYVEDARVGAEYAGRDMGISTDELVRRLRAYDATADLDPVASIIMNGGSVPIRQFEEILGHLHQAVRSVK